jgi:DNA polymerase III epsilon subunit-like protein
MTPSRTTTPLGQRIQRILLERKGEPVSLLELQTILRRQGQRINPERLRSVLSDTNVFTALPEQRYVLRDQFEPEHPSSEPTAARPPLFLPNLPKAQKTYMVLDLETSGLDPAKDQIIQIAALLVEDNTPTTLRSWYVQCAAERLPPALRRTLHLTEELVKRITTSPPIDDIWPEVRAFLSDHTLVIHNARFDTGFLRHYDPLFANSVVDTMELAFLVAPESPQHKLKILADFLNINIDALDTSTIAGMPAGFRPGTDTLHNAITDILLLNEVYRLLRQRWHATPPEQATLYGTLLPEVWRTPPTAPLHIATLMDSAQPPADTAPTQGRRIALATAFKNLQDQLCGEVARLQAVIPFQAQVLKGASSYVCLQAVQQALDDAYHPDLEPDLERRFVLTYLVRWLMDCPTATLDELPYWLKRTFPETNFLAHEVAVDRATCPQHRCSFYHPCRFFTAYHQGEQADVLLINQALWLSDSALLPSFDALIFDEAHNLEAMATSALRQEVSEESLRRLLHRLYVPGTRRGALQRILDLKPDDEHRAIIHTLRRSIGQVLRLIGEFRTTLSTFVTGCDERLDPAHGAQLRLTGAPERIYPTRWKMVQQALDQVWHVYMPTIVTELHQVSAWLPTDEHILHLTIQAIHSGLTEQQQLLQTILRARRSDLVAWIEVCTDEQTGGWGFFTAPISVAPILAERYRELRSVVLTSATLTTGPRDFRFFVERLGLRELLAADQMHAPWRVNCPTSKTLCSVCQPT